VTTTDTMDDQPAPPGRPAAPAADGRDPPTRIRALVRYLGAALLARTADSGAAVGLVLLAISPATGLRNGAATGGLLAAGLTAPHLLGPWVARWLDRARDGRKLLAAAFAGYGLGLAAAAILLSHARLLLVAALIGLAGLCGPLLTGGLSSRLAGIAGPQPHAQRRAEGWDAVSYGLAGTAGPAAVAGLAALTTPLVAVLTLAAAPLAAAAVTLTLPPTTPATSPPNQDQPLTVRAALRLLASHGPLRRVTMATMLTALSTGGLAVVAVVLGGQLSARPGAGAALAAAFGLGNLAGSLLVTALPLQGEPETLTARSVAVMAAALGLCAVAPTYPLAMAAFALVGASNAPFFTATLAARSLYSPPQARAQVFVSMAGLKVAMAAASTAAAGATIGYGPRGLLGVAAAITLLAAATALLDRRISPHYPTAR
jgi:MFS family permease